MNPVEEFKMLFERMADLCEKNDWGDPFSYARSKEIHIAGTLGHRVSGTLSGADGIDEDGECEYKSTITKSIKGSYTGISVQSSWEEQVEYLLKEKIAKYKNHYMARYDGGKVVELYKLPGMVVFDLLLPKLKKKYPTILTKKDPRVSATLTQKEIYTHGEKIL